MTIVIIITIVVVSWTCFNCENRDKLWQIYTMYNVHIYIYRRRSHVRQLLVSIHKANFMIVWKWTCSIHLQMRDCVCEFYCFAFSSSLFFVVGFARGMWNEKFVAEKTHGWNWQVTILLKHTAKTIELFMCVRTQPR